MSVQELEPNREILVLAIGEEIYFQEIQPKLLESDRKQVFLHDKSKDLFVNPLQHPNTTLRTWPGNGGFPTGSSTKHPGEKPQGAFAKNNSG
jgi:hypothetical protein